MITEIQYLEAVKIVNQYLLQQVPKPIIKKSKKSYKINRPDKQESLNEHKKSKFTKFFIKKVE